MSQFSTHAGQAQHYSAVRARLYGLPTVPRIQRTPAMLAPTEQAPEKPPARCRDFLHLRSKFINTLPHTCGGVWQHAACAEILSEVAEKHQVAIGQIKGAGRQREVTAARFEAYYRISTELGYSLPMIGKSCGGKEHTGVMHGIRKHKERMEAAGL